MPVPKEIKIRETLFWFVRHLVLIPIFPPTIPIYDRSVEFFVDSYHDFYSDLILVVQVPAGKKILGKYLEAYEYVMIGKVLLLAGVSG